MASTRLYPTHRYAKALLEETDSEELQNTASVRALASQLQALDADQRPYLLQQYANIWRNRQELGIL